MHKVLQPRDDVIRLYVSRKGESELATIEHSIGSWIQRLEDCIEKRGGRLITSTRNNTDDMKIKRIKITRKQKWQENNCINVLSD